MTTVVDVPSGRAVSTGTELEVSASLPRVDVVISVETLGVVVSSSPPGTADVVDAWGTESFGRVVDVVAGTVVVVTGTPGGCVFETIGSGRTWK